MAKNSKEALGAEGKKDVMLFDPENLVIVEDVASALFDERAGLDVDERLVLNIMLYGILEPVLVRKNQDTGSVELVDGRQRVKACREANRRLKARGEEPHRVPAIVKRGEAFALMGMMVSANEIRRDDSPIIRARKMQRFLDLGRTAEEAVVVFGVTAQTVKNLTGLLDASKPVQNAVERGLISSSDGYKLAKLPPEEQKERLEKLQEAAPPRVSGGSAVRKRRTSAEVKAARTVLDGAPGLPGKKEIAAMLGTVRQRVAMREMHRAGAEAALQWVLGDSETLETLLGGEEQDESSGEPSDPDHADVHVEETEPESDAGGVTEPVEAVVSEQEANP